MNSLGGILCVVCSPSKNQIDDIQKLWSEGGVWVDRSGRFEMVEAIPAKNPARPPATAEKATAGGNHNFTRNATTKNPLVNSSSRFARGPSGEWSEAEWSVIERIIDSAEVWGPNVGYVVTLRPTRCLNAKNTQPIRENEDENDKKELSSDRGSQLVVGGLAIEDLEAAFIGISLPRLTGENPLQHSISGEETTKVKEKTKKKEAKLNRNVDSFRGPLKPGVYEVSEVGADQFGNAFVTLSRNGQVCVSGLFCERGDISLI